MVDELCDRITVLQDQKTAMLSALMSIASILGCECDSYEGHKCALCIVRDMARQGLEAAND